MSSLPRGSAAGPQPAATAGAAAPQPSNSGPVLPDFARRKAGDPTGLGRTNAPVVLIEYSDFRCPFCGVFARQTLPALVHKYVDTGKLRFERRDLPVFGDQSVQAAVAARAAGNQGRYWQFHEKVYAIAPERGHASLTQDTLKRLATEAGVPDLARFTRDLSSSELASAVQRDAEEAASIGADATPTFLVNGHPILGAQPLDLFEQEIDAALKAAGTH
ncbi:DsbA family protein [Paenarthrobacter sp. DKR-5]|uniref:DsbA family protein n=1 Tax=Paenarthrobacter sp. DKR-5 TaxID=2835535 RepID=UPI0020291981|nr:DsbA family protein [Paenarthrobacter sp. DKR-5]